MFDDELDEGLPRGTINQTGGSTQSYNNTTSNVFSQRAESTISSFERMVVAGVNALRAYSKIDANAAAEKLTSILQLAESDYIEGYVYAFDNSGTPQYVAGNSNKNGTQFMMYRIIE